MSRVPFGRTSPADTSSAAIESYFCLVLRAKCLDGDMQAMKILFDRVIPTDWRDRLAAAEQAKFKVIDAELTGIRNGKARLDVVGSPEPATNVGGKVFDSAGSVVCPPVKYFLDGMGDF